MIREKRAACAGCKALLAWHCLTSTRRPWASAALCASCDQQALESWAWREFDRAMKIQRPRAVNGARVRFEVVVS